MEYWPLLTDDHMTGAHPIERQLRPPTLATAVDRTDFPEAVRIILELYDSWGGAFMPLVPIAVGKPTPLPWCSLIAATPIDRLVSNDSMNEEERLRYAYAPGPIAEPQRLLTVLAKRPRPEAKANVSVCRQLGSDDPWYLAYLAIVGDLPIGANEAQNQRDQVLTTLTYSDVVNLREVGQTPSAEDLLAQIRSPDAWTVAQLTGSELGYWPAPVNKGFPDVNSVTLDAKPVATRYGPNLVVVYEPNSVDDLALIWHLRGLHGLKPGLPLAIPANVDVHGGLEYWSINARQLWGIDGGDMAVLSASVTDERLAEFVDGLDIDVVSIEDVLIPHRGCALVSSEIAVFDGGSASIPMFAPNDKQQLGDRLLDDIGRRASLTAVLTNHPLPTSETLRRGMGSSRGYIRGFSTTTSPSRDTAKIYYPTGLETLCALGLDHGMETKPSGPGRAGEHLMRMAGGFNGLSRLAFPGVTKLLREMTRGRNTTEVRNRLNRFLNTKPGEEQSERYKLVESRLDAALGQPDAEEVPYQSLAKIRNLLKISSEAAKYWTEWAVEQGLLLAGFEASCDRCLNKQWRILRDAVPPLICNGCGQPIRKPHPIDHLIFQYRASETLLRAINSDALPCILSLRYLNRLSRGSGGFFYGGYPGVDVIRISDGVTIGEADVALILNDGRWIVGECKTTALGLNQAELDKLWKLAESVDAAATFVATLDSSQACGELWKKTDGWNGRPHFALTAEHLYDLDGMQLYGTDPFAWRTEYYQMGQAGATGDSLRTAFETYLRRSTENTDADQPRRAPWM
jgi:hypothetical protein